MTGSPPAGPVPGAGRPAEAAAFDPPIGVAETLAPGLRRLVAPNAGPMTFRGTNTYLLGTGDTASIGGAITVIDPGPASERHLQAILAAAGAARIAAILVTHSHADHSRLARRLSEVSGAPVLAHGGPEAGRSAVMERLAGNGLGGGEGVDGAFVPDRTLADGEILEGPCGPITALWTPGHMGNHLSFLWGGGAFTGDLVMGWATSLISPPDGDLARFRASCARLRDMAPTTLWPGHGPPVPVPADRIDALLAHRAGRESQILDVLGRGTAAPRAIVARIYTDLPAPMVEAAIRNVLAHCIDLTERGQLVAEGDHGPETPYRRRET